MDKITKFLQKLQKKDLEIFLLLLEKIKNLELDWLDVKKLQGEKYLYRVRKGKIRIIFKKIDDKSTIINIDYRNKVYKKL